MDHAKLVDGFLVHAEAEQPKVAKMLGKLTGDAHAKLGEVLHHFDYARAGELSDKERALAHRVLKLLHKPTHKSLTALIEVFAYLDGDANAMLDHAERALAVDILEMFCKADSVNQTLSQKELQMLLAVLDDIDADNSGVLERKEAQHLFDQLWDPDAFLAEQRGKNERLRKLMD